MLFASTIYVYSELGSIYRDSKQACEKIIEELAGRFYTFTNPAKFPQIIKNKPEVEDSRILMCDCLLGDCQQCQLSKSAENAIKKNKSLKEIFGWSDN